MANGVPVLAKKLLGSFAAWPLDNGADFIDGRRLFGRSKTVRGVVLSIAVTSIVAPLLGLPVALGCVVGTLAMAGDLFSSFVKRRMSFSSSTMAVGLDQVPESLFPLLASSLFLDINFADITVATAAFFIGELICSRLLFALGLRDRPF